MMFDLAEHDADICITTDVLIVGAGGDHKDRPNDAGHR
jgi:hypothetical protein